MMHDPTNERRYILTLSCQDVRGIVAAVSSFLAEHDGFILESHQFGDFATGRFFMRTEFTAGTQASAGDMLREKFIPVAEQFGMEWALHNMARKPRVMMMVSKAGHCLNHLLYRYQSGQLPIEIPAILSNHSTLQEMAKVHNIPFHHLPIAKDAKEAQEARVLEIMKEVQADVVVLARYMQILSANLCENLHGRAINIHHSFLPGFKGANPYRQAFDRGVKLIGATAHYVTEDLDEGPIIEQEVLRVDHTDRPDDLKAMGQDIESRVLTRALQNHIQHRVLLNGEKTVVFK